MSSLADPLGSDPGVEFTEEELAGIAELRKRLKEFTDEPGDTLAKDYIKEDTTMWRYVLAQSREDDPMENSTEMFRLSIAWRKEIRLLSHMVPEWRGGPPGVSETTKEAKGERAAGAPTAATARARLGDLCFYAGLLKVKSKNNGPMLAERMGVVDLAGLYRDQYAFDATADSYIVYLEQSWQSVRRSGTKVRGIIVCDITGAGLGMINYISVIKQISSKGILYYPEITEKVILVNAGWIISTLWAAVRPFLPKRTKGKFKILGSSEAELEEHLYPYVVGGRDQLPSFLGGKLGEDQHSVCPATQVDEAYGIVLDEVIEWKNLAGDKEYPDTKEFLAKCRGHAEANQNTARMDKIDAFVSKHGLSLPEK